MGGWDTALYDVDVFDGIPFSGQTISFTPSSTVTIGGYVTQVLAWNTSHGLNQIGQATLTIPYPILSNVVHGARVTITVEDDGPRTIFDGRLRMTSASLGDDGRSLSCSADGWLYLLDPPQNRDVAFAGGARTSRTVVIGAAVHVGSGTLAHYSHDVGQGLTYDVPFTPLTDSTFLIVEGKIHGANAYVTEFDGNIGTWSRIDILQAGKKIGYANFPIQDEPAYGSGDDPPNYGSDADSWDEFSLTIGAKIVGELGDVTIRFVAGRRPGSNERDHYEVKSVTAQTAGDVSARNVIRGLFSKRGYGAADIPYTVDEIVNLGGRIVMLGGNGLVDNGQVRIEKTESFRSFAERICSLFGYAIFDRPDGRVRVQAVRGKPKSSAPLAGTFAEGIDLMSLSADNDQRDIVTWINVTGASGTDPDGKKFQYESHPDEGEVTPNPDGVFLIDGISDNLLVSDALCRDVRRVAEASNGDSTGSENYLNATFETWGRPRLQPGDVIWLTSSTLNFDSRLFVISVEHAWSDDGLWTTLKAWSGAGVTLPEGDDDPTEPIPALSDDPTPRQQWQSYKPTGKWA